MHVSRQYLFGIGTFLLTVGVLAGCEEGVDPYVGDSKPFTLYGYMDAGSDTQKVRVFSLEQRLGLDRTGPIDAKVTSLDLDTGERHTWKDSLVSFADLGNGHVFWSKFQAQHAHRYRLEVKRSDGATSSVEVRVPSEAQVEVDTQSPTPLVSVQIRGKVPNILGVKMVYKATSGYLPPVPPGRPESIFYPVTISYQDGLTRAGDAWEFSVNLARDADEIRAEYNRNCLSRWIGLRRLELRLLAADSSWALPEGSSDLGKLIEPTAFTNVENGYGFFGAGQTISFSWLPPSAVQLDIGFNNKDSAGVDVNDGLPCFRCDEDLPLEVRQVYCRTQHIN